MKNRFECFDCEKYLPDRNRAIEHGFWTGHVVFMAGVMQVWEPTLNAFVATTL